MILDPKDLSALLRRMGPPLVPLDTVLQATEVTFLSAGRNLENAVDGLRDVHAELGAEITARSV